MTALVTGLISLGMDVWKAIRDGQERSEVKLEARERLYVLIDNAAAKERLRRRKHLKSV